MPSGYFCTDWTPRPGGTCTWTRVMQQDKRCFPTRKACTDAVSAARTVYCVGKATVQPSPGSLARVHACTGPVPLDECVNPRALFKDLQDCLLAHPHGWHAAPSPAAPGLAPTGGWRPHIPVVPHTPAAPEDEDPGGALEPCPAQRQGRGQEVEVTSAVPDEP